jgi:ribosomal protein S18 acetylase RimI-like enzyme
MPARHEIAVDRHPGAPGVDIRRLVPADAAAYRELMLEAYTAHPRAFTSTVAEREGLPLDWWRSRMADEPTPRELVIGAFDGARLVGAVGLAFETRPRIRHRCTLFGMVVRAPLRGRRIGRHLVETALREARAREGVRVVQLTVSDDNRPARALYERCGFVAFGLEPLAVAIDGEHVAKLHMWRDLADSA